MTLTASPEEKPARSSSTSPSRVRRPSLQNHNRDNVDRSMCLTAGAGDGAAWSCGDLVITHAMPTYTTMDKGRTSR